MNIIRKRKRTYKTSREKRVETDKKLPIADILLFLGIMAVIIGPILGIIEYDIYKNGRAEHIENTKEGTIYKPAIAPGEPGRRASAISGFYIGGFGLILIILSLIIYEISVSNKNPENKILRRIHVLQLHIDGQTSRKNLSAKKLQAGFF